MRRRHVLGAICGLAIACFSEPASAETPDAAFDALLAKYMSPRAEGANRVDYARWKASPQDLSSLNSYINELTARAPSTMPRNGGFAFWCNLYNAITLKVVLDRYPVSSIRDIKSVGLFDPKAYIGPWRTKRVTVEGQSYSLDDLDTAAREFINHPRAVTVLPNNRLRVSSIYKWFSADFGGNDATILAHLRKYAGAKLAAALASHPTITEDGYDWSLNDVPTSGKSQ